MYATDRRQQRLVQLNGLSMSDQEKARLKAELAYVKRELAAMKASIRPLVEENVQLKLAAEQVGTFLPAEVKRNRYTCCC